MYYNARCRETKEIDIQLIQVTEIPQNTFYIEIT